MPIKFKSGFIYFLGERDLQTGEWSDQVKIGKTDYDRPVDDRINDHQTGNPRQVIDRESFQVVSIDTVETHLHHAFAEYRTLGEWFRMDESTLKEAIAEAKLINSELEASGGALASASEANDEVSDEPERAAREEEVSLLAQAVEAGESLNRLKARQSSLEWELRAMMGSAGGIDGILSIIPVQGSPKFDEKALLAEEPTIHEKFMVEGSSFKRSFSLATKTRSPAKLEPGLATREKECKEIAVKELDGFDKPLAERSEQMADLHGRYLKILGETSHAGIQKDLLEAKIKAACGKAKGISGICSWSRMFETKSKFDRDGFINEHPELSEKYLLPPSPPELRISINQMRPYATIKTSEALGEDGSSSWPVARLEAALVRREPSADDAPNAARLSATDRKRKCVLLATGAMNPIHRGHVEMLVHARRTLEDQHDFQVLAGFLSPSHDDYVKAKSGSSGAGFVEARHRVEMARLAAAKHEWIEVAAWEARQTQGAPDFPEVVNDLQEFLKENFDEEIFVLYVCGSDHVKHCRQGFGKPRQGLIVVPRNEQYDHEDVPGRLVFKTPPLACIQGFSSTAAREAIAEGREGQLDELGRMLEEDVLAYALRHRLYDTVFGEILIEGQSLEKPPGHKVSPRTSVDHSDTDGEKIESSERTQNGVRAVDRSDISVSSSTITTLLYREEGLERKHAERTATWFDRFPGPLTIEVIDRPVRLTPNAQGKLVWDDVFHVLGKIRQERQTPPHTGIALLTKTPNEQNWFAVQDPNQMRNGFIHLDDFSWVTSAPSEIIGAHFLLKGLYNTLLHEAEIPWQEMIHHEPRGCLFDFCSDKRDLGFKLRTADVCGDCMHVFQSAGIPEAILRQTVAIMEGTRRLALNTGQYIEREASFSDWPFPVAVTRHKAVQSSNPLLRFMMLLDHFDCLVRYAYLSHEIGAETVPRLEERPSLGWWVRQLRAVVSDDSPFREVVRIAEEERVVNLRNERRGHGWMSASEESYRGEAKDLEAIIDKIEDELRSFLENQSLVIPRQISLRDSSWLVEGEKLMGSHLIHPSFRLETEEDPRSTGITSENEVYLSDRKMRQFRKISPYVRSGLCPECRHQRILLTDGGQKYIDVFMGHRVKLQNS